MLGPEGRIGLACTVGVMVYAIFQMEMPAAVDVRTVETGDPDASAGERAATWKAAAAVSGIALMAKSSEVFVVGGIATVTCAWTYRHADQVNPLTKKAAGLLTAGGAAQAQMPEAAPAVEHQANITPLYSAVI